MTPRGLGLYLRGLKGEGPETYGTKLLGAGITWVAIGGPWHDRRGHKWINRPDVVQDWIDVLTGLGLEVYVWGYPSARAPQDFASDVIDCLTSVCRGVILDPEKAMKVPGELDDDAMELIIESIRAYADVEMMDGFEVAVTSYGEPKYHRALPWKTFKLADWCSPQLYGVFKKELADAMIRRWRAATGCEVIVPSFGLYLPKILFPDSGDRPLTRVELRKHLNAVGAPPAIGWSDRSLTPDLLEELRYWGEGSGGLVS